MNRKVGEFLVSIWVIVIVLIIIISTINIFTTKMRVEEEDIYGEYIVDRSKFPGKEANWQYNHFKIRINRKKELILHQIENGAIYKSDTIKIEILDGYINKRVKLDTDSYVHHILDSNPTLYRDTWSFYYVFKSPKFGNMFFTKGKWMPES